MNLKVLISVIPLDLAKSQVVTFILIFNHLNIYFYYVNLQKKMLNINAREIGKSQ